MTLPPDTPYWLVILALLAGWLGANVWPSLRAIIAQRSGVDTEIRRARAEADLARSDREVEALEAKAAAERQIADALVQLGQLVQVNITETRENKTVLTSLSTAFSAQIGLMPTLRDMQEMTNRISAIEAHLSLDAPRRNDGKTWQKREADRHE